MKQHEAVIEAMRANGGYATLGLLYQKALKIRGVEWKTKTPFKSINRIVQDERFFFRIRPGLWALKEYKDKLPAEIKEIDKPEYNHSYYQGLLVELGDRQTTRNLHTATRSWEKVHGQTARRSSDPASTPSVHVSGSSEACAVSGRHLV